MKKYNLSEERIKWMEEIKRLWSDGKSRSNKETEETLNIPASDKGWALWYTYYDLLAGGVDYKRSRGIYQRPSNYEN
jgi:hypothetical protein